MSNPHAVARPGPRQRVAPRRWGRSGGRRSAARSIPASLQRAGARRRHAWAVAAAISRRGARPSFSSTRSRQMQRLAPSCAWMGRTWLRQSPLDCLPTRLACQTCSMARDGSTGIPRGSSCSESCPTSIDLAVGLSPPVARSLPALVERVVEEAAGLGFVFSRVAHTDTDETPLPLGAVDVARLARVR